MRSGIAKGIRPNDKTNILVMEELEAI